MTELEIDQSHLPRVQEVCGVFAVLEDGALAHNLQEQEIEQYYTTNIQKNQLVQNDIRIAKRLQDEEEEQRAQQRALVSQASRQLLEQDSEYARMIQEEFQRGVEEARRREKEDEEIAKRIQQEEEEEEEEEEQQRVRQRTSRQQSLSDDSASGPDSPSPSPCHHTPTSPHQAEGQHHLPAASRGQCSTSDPHSDCAEPQSGSPKATAGQNNRILWTNDGHTMDPIRHIKNDLRDPDCLSDGSDSDMDAVSPVQLPSLEKRINTAPCGRQAPVHHLQERNYSSLHSSFREEGRGWEEDRGGREGDRGSRVGDRCSRVGDRGWEGNRRERDRGGQEGDRGWERDRGGREGDRGGREEREERDRGWDRDHRGEHEGRENSTHRSNGHDRDLRSEEVRERRYSSSDSARGRDRDRDIDEDRHRDRDIDGDRHRDRDIDEDRHRDRDKDGDRHRDRDIDGDRHRDIDGDRHMDRHGERDGDRDRDIDGDRHRDRDRDRHRERDGDRDRDIDEDRHRDRDGDRDRDRYRDRDIGGDRHRERDRDRHRERDGDGDRDRDRDRVRRSWTYREGSRDRPHVHFQEQEANRRFHSYHGDNSSRVWEMLGHALRERGVAVRQSFCAPSRHVRGVGSQVGQVHAGGDVAHCDAQPHQRAFQRAVPTRRSYHGDIRERRRTSRRDDDSDRARRHDNRTTEENGLAKVCDDDDDDDSRDCGLASRERGGSSRRRRTLDPRQRVGSGGDEVRGVASVRRLDPGENGVRRSASQHWHGHKEEEEKEHGSEEAQEERARKEERRTQRGPQRSQSFCSREPPTRARAWHSRAGAALQPQLKGACLDLGALQQVLQDEELARRLQEEEEKLLRRIPQPATSPCNSYPREDFRVAQVAQDEEIARFMQRQEIKSKRRSHDLDGSGSWREHREMADPHDRRVARERQVQRERLDSEGLPSPSEDCPPELQPPSPTTTITPPLPIRNIAEELDPTFKARRQGKERTQPGQTTSGPPCQSHSAPHSSSHDFLEEPTFIPPTKRPSDKSGRTKPKEKKESCKQQ